MIGLAALLLWVVTSSLQAQAPAPAPDGVQVLPRQVPQLRLPAAQADLLTWQDDGRQFAGLTFYADSQGEALWDGSGAASGDATSGGAARAPNGPLLINFWATWCAPCIEELPQLEALALQAPAGLRVLAVSLDRDGEQARRFLSDRGFVHLDLAFDRRMAAFRALGGQGVPHSVLLTGERRQIASLAGTADWASPEMLAALTAVLSAAAH